MKLDPDMFLLYRAAQKGVYGRCRRFGQSSITDALFLFLDGDPDPESETVLHACYTARPWVCLTESWESFIREQYPQAAVYRRQLMKPAESFRIPKNLAIPAGYRISMMDEAAFSRHPFSHGKNYPSCSVFQAEGSGCVAWLDGEIVASASSFLSLNGEIELDVFTREEHRGKGLASACVARMLQDCSARRITVHWDAQNETSRHLAEKFGFETETEYPVYWFEGNLQG